MPQRRANKKGKGGANARAKHSNVKKSSEKNSMMDQIMKNATSSAMSSSGAASSGTNFKGPTDAERQFPKLTDEQVMQFLANDGKYEEDNDAPTIGASAIDVADKCCSGGCCVGCSDAGCNDGDDGGNDDEDDDLQDDLQGEMPEPPPMDDSSLIGRMMNPDAGGKGKNRDGTAGLLAPPKPSGNNRQRLRAKIRAMREQRTTLNEQTTVRDANGRKMPGRMLSPEAVQAGIRPPKNSQIDQTLTAQKRKELFEAMKANMNQKREAQLASVGATTTTSATASRPVIVDDDSNDIGM
jgi:hypothetical protein